MKKYREAYINAFLLMSCSIDNPKWTDAFDNFQEFKNCLTRQKSLKSFYEVSKKLFDLSQKDIVNIHNDVEMPHVHNGLIVTHCDGAYCEINERGDVLVDIDHKLRFIAFSEEIHRGLKDVTIIGVYEGLNSEHLEDARRICEALDASERVINSDTLMRIALLGDSSELIKEVQIETILKTQSKEKLHLSRGESFTPVVGQEYRKKRVNFSSADW